MQGANTNEIISIFLKWLIPFVCAGICSIVLAIMKKHKKEQEESKQETEAIKNAVKSLLRAEIIRQYEKYSDKGYCPIYAREPLTLAHDSYHALGGNSTATDLYHKTMKLPTEPEEGV